MKCPRCGGPIVHDPGCYPHGPEDKCMSCGRRIEDPPDPKRRREMETKRKVCSKCHIEKDVAEFSLNRSAPDGREYKCKQCWKEIRAEKKKMGGASRKAPADPKPKRAAHQRTKPMAATPLTTASPTEIVVALRKGIAAEILGEILALINDRYGL
jgi:DNA-directed RNA polymerase subunit RPC12/RpoP